MILSFGCSRLVSMLDNISVFVTWPIQYDIVIHENINVYSIKKIA